MSFLNVHKIIVNFITFNDTKKTLIYVLIDLSLITGRYFDEISQDTGKYCFGVEDTLKALEMGAVEVLIVHENLNVVRYVLHCQGTEEEEIV